MKPAAMNANFGVFVTGELSARFLINQLTETIEEATFLVFDSTLQQVVGKTKRRELLDRMREQSHSNAAFLHVGDALVDAACNAALMQVERERQSADAAADDCNVRRCFFHSFCPGRWTLTPVGQHPAGRALPTIDGTIEPAFRFQAPADSSQ